jgi:hypothetical protein
MLAFVRRAQTTAPHREAQSTGGVTGVPLMPFPFLNPWNWSVMTPSREVAAGLFSCRCGLDGWRNVADAWQAMLRDQQDAMLSALQHQVDHVGRDVEGDGPEARTRSRGS